MKRLKRKEIMYLSTILISICILSVFSLAGCKKLIEIDSPIQVIVGKEIYNSNSGAASVLTGIYVQMAEDSFVHGGRGVSINTGLSSDELSLYDGNNNLTFENLYRNNPVVVLGNGLWSDLYGYVFRANAAIEGIEGSGSISGPVKKQLLGEAKFIRALCYFYLVNLYGDVPVLTSTNFKVNIAAPRVAVTSVYQQIISDLLEAKEGLSENYLGADIVSSTSERVRPNKFAAAALLSRVYLYTGQWDKAETEASIIIANNNYTLVGLEKVFLMNSKETVWALQARTTVGNDQDGALLNLLPSENGPSIFRPIYLSVQLWNAFEPGDHRKSEWIGAITANGTTYPYANKYKTNAISSVITEYPMVFRLGEQYLIRAEARVQQDKIIGANSAKSDLDAIRIRAGLGETTAANKADILAAIFKERRVELFTEWGNRWFDLKRTNQIDKVMPAVCIAKNAVWASFKALYPIPAGDIKANPSLRGHQNAGYPEQ